MYRTGINQKLPTGIQTQSDDKNAIHRKRNSKWVYNLFNYIGERMHFIFIAADSDKRGEF